MNPKIDAIESDRLLLEVRKESHGRELYSLFCEKDLYHYMIRDVPVSEEWLAAGFKKSESLISPDGKELWLGWVGREKLSQLPVGVFEITIVKREAFIAYTVFKENWGAGFAVEASQALMNYISTNFEIDRFVIEMDTRNRGSVKVAEKLGFDFVKVINNAAFLKNFVSHEFQFQKLIL
jgi:RimJ/RimL family protein N-acetyltransferase